MLTIALAVAAAAFGYIQTRKFVRRRLAYVDAAQGVGAPVLSGFAAFVLVLFLTPLPLIGMSTALLVGAGVGVGFNAGTKDTHRRRLGA